MDKQGNGRVGRMEEQKDIQTEGETSAFQD